MNPVSTRLNGADILYDADLLDKIDPALFDAESLRDRGMLLGEARGRGTTWLFRYERLELVLRHYRRGGVFGPWLGDRYLWLGHSRTRALREWRLLAQLREQGLPVPRPVAARVQRHGWCYRADLVTERIPAVVSLAQALVPEPLSQQRWYALGKTLHRFHAIGVCHADLNAHNILLTPGEIYLIDFDRGRLRAPGAWRRGNLARLRRSLDKLHRTQAVFHFRAADWELLLAGYEAGAASAGQSSASAAR